MISKECLRLNEILTVLYSTKNKEEAFQNTLRCLKKWIPFDKGDIYFYDLSNGIPKMKEFLSIGWGQNEKKKYINDYYMLDDVIPLISSKVSIMFRSSDIFSSEDRMKSEYYFKVLKPMGMDFSIEGGICCVGNTIGGIGLHRKEDTGDFTQEELELMKLLSSHLRNVATEYIASTEAPPQVTCLNATSFIGYGLWNSNYYIEWENLSCLGITNIDKEFIIHRIVSACRKLNKNTQIIQAVSLKTEDKEAAFIKERSYLTIINKFEHQSAIYFCVTVIDFNGIMEGMLGSLQDDINLTKREREIVCLAMYGVETADIAKAFFIDVSTVKKHLTNSYQKMGIKGKYQIVNFLLRRSKK